MIKNKISASDSDHLRGLGIDTSDLFLNPYFTNEYQGASLEWLDFYVRFSQLKKNVYDGIIELSEEDGFSIIKRKIESIPLSLEIKKTYLSFHICECSTVSYEEAPNTDFGGEYSIEKMFEDVLFEINKKLGLTTSDVLKYYGIEYVEKSVKDSTESIISKTQSNESKK